MSESPRRRVLITGAAGRIGSCYAAHAHEKYDLRLMVRESDQNVDRIAPYGEVMTCDLADLTTLKRLCAGIDTVVHLAGCASGSGTWRELLDANIIGTYHIFAAAKSAGCKRVIYASSIHAVSGYPPDRQVKTDDMVNPGDLYGVSKCFGEAMARYMAEQEGLSSIAIRIASYWPHTFVREGNGIEFFDTLVSDRDLNQLIDCCIDTENIRFALVHGVSNNRFKRLDITDTCAKLGYAPQDDITEDHPLVRELHIRAKTRLHNLSQGMNKSGLREDIG